MHDKLRFVVTYLLEICNKMGSSSTPCVQLRNRLNYCIFRFTCNNYRDISIYIAYNCGRKKKLYIKPKFDF